MKPSTASGKKGVIWGWVVCAEVISPRNKMRQGRIGSGLESLLDASLTARIRRFSTAGIPLQHYNGATWIPPLEYIRPVTYRSKPPPRFDNDSQSILTFIKNSSVKLNSLTLRYVGFSLQNLADLSALIPMVTELDFEGLGEESLRHLAIKPNSRRGVPMARASDSALQNIFYSRLYLAPNVNIIQNMSPLQHAEIHILSIDRPDAPTYFGESHQDGPELRGLISRLQSIYSITAGLDKEQSGQASPKLGVLEHSYSVYESHRWPRSKTFLKAEVTCRIDEDIFPKQGELGYYEGEFATQEPFPLLTLPQQPFLQKLDAVFMAFEGYRITHALDILKNEADALMRKFSSIPETAFLHHPTYKFHSRAARLLEKWQPILIQVSCINFTMTAALKFVGQLGLGIAITNVK
ncbi:hypothetical protein BD779DRAFT_1479888 [Infundibulicybe gibba]|nr:hypothetical protein BD779DRAFT_1479888 [Infundibulicybe gibba]